MTKLSVFGQAFVAGIVFFSEGAEGSQIVTSSEEKLRDETMIHSEDTVGIKQHNLTQKINMYSNFIEYFESEDTTGENERYGSSPWRYPVFYIDQSIWENGERSERKEDGGILSRILRRLQVFGFDDTYDTGETPRQDDNLINQRQYKNYSKIEVEEHKEKLITDDDGLYENKLDDDPSATLTPQIDDDPTLTALRQTPAPSPLDSSYWAELGSFDSNMEEDAQKPTNTQITDTDLLLQRKANSVVVRIVLGVVGMEAMEQADIKNIINMVARAQTTVLNEDTENPFVVYDTLDLYNRNRDLGESALPFTNFRGQGQPQQRDGKGEKYLARLFLDNVVVEPGEHNWWEISSIYTVWRYDDAGPVNRRSVLTVIEGICSNSIEKSMDENIYWESLTNVGLGDQDLILQGHMYFIDEKGVLDVKDVGDEYDMSDMYCDMYRPVDQDGDFECPEIDSMNTYSTVIADSIMEVEWGIREWFGLVLMFSTTLFVVSLSFIADRVLRKRRKQLLWGAALTPNGVDDFLQVGWQIYEKPPEEQPTQGLAPAEGQQQQQQQAQLYLHIYDKGKGEGYNDENSLLKGGAEPQLFAPSTDADPVSFPPTQHQHENSACENVANPNESS